MILTKKRPAIPLRFIRFTCATLLLAACVPAESHVLLGQPADVLVLSPERSAAWVPAVTGHDACRARIRQILCLLDASVNPPGATCVPGGEAYAARFETLYDQFPQVLQRVFCSLNRIDIVPGFFATAFAGLDLDDAGHARGALLGVRQAFVDNPLSLEAWSTWKEQLSLGGSQDPNDAASGTLPAVTAQPGADMLFFVVAHEFGHILDFANGANRMDMCKMLPHGHIECASAEGSWSALSWLGEHFTPRGTGGMGTMSPVVRPEFDFQHRHNLCFYGCRNPAMLDAGHVSELYSGLATSPFISTYAATNPHDDFAETLAYVTWAEMPAAQYFLDTRQGAVYDILSKLHSPQFAAKRAFMHAFLHRTNLVYPGAAP